VRLARLVRSPVRDRRLAFFVGVLAHDERRELPCWRSGPACYRGWLQRACGEAMSAPRPVVLSTPRAPEPFETLRADFEVRVLGYAPGSSSRRGSGVDADRLVDDRDGRRHPGGRPPEGHRELRRRRQPDRPLAAAARVSATLPTC
jgi:hypothetical protein